MRLVFSLELPTDLTMVPVARHLCRNALEEFGVLATCVSEVSLALTEACANVIEHSTQVTDFELQFEISKDACSIKVIDHGKGFDAALAVLDEAPFAQDAEGGRGLYLMREAVDEIEIVSDPHTGTVVTLVKKLSFREDSVAAPFMHDVF